MAFPGSPVARNHCEHLDKSSLEFKEYVTMAVFLGIDVGTSGTKTLAIQEDGAILASATAEYPLMSPRPGWSEQDPEDWWEATVTTVKKVLKAGKIKPEDVAGIGLSGQMHGSVFLDKQHNVIRHALLWNDQRTAAECTEIENKVGGRTKLIEMVANPALTGFTAPKILWLQKNEPKNYSRTAQILLPKDFIRFRLTGEFATDVSDASGTLLLDVKNRQWCKPLLDKLDIKSSLLPKVYESEDVTGQLSESAAKLLGLKKGVPVVGGAGDQAAGAVGNGIVKRGIISATMGTSGVVFAHSDEMQMDPAGRVHTFCHAVRGKWHVMGVVLSAGQPAVVPKPTRRNRSRRGEEDQDRSLQYYHRAGIGSPSGLRRPVLPAVSDGRTDASRRCECPRMLGGAQPAAWTCRADPVDHGRIDLRHARLPGNHQ